MIYHVLTKHYWFHVKTGTESSILQFDVFIHS